MKNKQLSNHYQDLTPEERFRLILAASGRGDAVERERLVRAGKKIKISRQDHACYANAFNEISLIVFLDVLEWAARYCDALACIRIIYQATYSKTQPTQSRETSDPTAGEVDKEKKDNDGAVTEGCPKLKGAKGAIRRVRGRSLGLLQACGYMLLTKVDGWKQFCAHMSVPAFALWEGLPGFERLQHSLEHARGMVFDEADFLSWLNSIRPQKAAEVTVVSLTTEAVAATIEATYRQRSQWWGG